MNKKENPMANKEFGIPEEPKQPVFPDEIVNPQYNISMEGDINPQYNFGQESTPDYYSSENPDFTSGSAQQDYPVLNNNEQFTMQGGEYPNAHPVSDYSQQFNAPQGYQQQDYNMNDPQQFNAPQGYLQQDYNMNDPQQFNAPQSYQQQDYNMNDPQQFNAPQGNQQQDYNMNDPQQFNAPENYPGAHNDPCNADPDETNN